MNIIDDVSFNPIDETIKEGACESPFFYDLI
jgi:hypothetical protein